MWEEIEKFLGLSGLGIIGYILGIFFYLSGCILILYWVVEISIKFIHLILGKYRKNYRTNASKLIIHKTFRVSILLKFTGIVLTIFFAFIQANRITEIFYKYVNSPHNLITLIKNERIFLIIFFIILIYELSLISKTENKGV